ncbi:mitochondrial genome maintenance protein [Acrasis kona]|uniref:Mitochondrial genome maintenance protein n=1 Tax=Acrasis kona TaxID=1008807 RepID=A0AAW2ZET0_9EUKA
MSLRLSNILLKRTNQARVALGVHTTPKSIFLSRTFHVGRFIRNEQNQVPYDAQTNLSQNSFANISAKPFRKEVADILMAPLEEGDIEIKPDNILYLPEIKYRRILNKAFGPGGWALMPRGPHSSQAADNSNILTQEFALFCQGQFVSQAHGEQTIGIGIKSLATALEGVKSNALMRCCKDIGIASELWDPQFIMDWKKKYSIGVWCENNKTGHKKILYRRKDRPEFTYPYREVQGDVNTQKTVITPSSGFDLAEQQHEAPSDNTTNTDSDFDPNKIWSFGKFKGRTYQEVSENNKSELESYISYLKKKNLHTRLVADLESYMNNKE